MEGDSISTRSQGRHVRVRLRVIPSGRTTNHPPLMRQGAPPVTQADRRRRNVSLCDSAPHSRRGGGSLNTTTRSAAFQCRGQDLNLRCSPIGYRIYSPAPSTTRPPLHLHCPARVRTWNLLTQNQTCCQLHHGAETSRIAQKATIK